MSKLTRAAAAAALLTLGAGAAGAQEIGSPWFLWEPGTHNRAAASTFERVAPPAADLVARPAVPQASNPGDCQPGAYWYMKMEDAVVPMACPAPGQ
jgi:hypothetical protein